jgi:hypothetical protein
MTTCYLVDLRLSQEYAIASRANDAMPSSHELQDEFPEKRSQKSRDQVKSNPLEPTTTGALLLQSLLRLHAPHNALVLDRYAQGKRPDALQL